MTGDINRDPVAVVESASLRRLERGNESTGSIRNIRFGIIRAWTGLNRLVLHVVVEALEAGQTEAGRHRVLDSCHVAHSCGRELVFGFVGAWTGVVARAGQHDVVRVATVYREFL